MQRNVKSNINRDRLLFYFGPHYYLSLWPGLETLFRISEYHGLTKFLTIHTATRLYYSDSRHDHHISVSANFKPITSCG